MSDRTTHFGFQEVAENAKEKKVAEVFSSVAHNYDVMNDLMSFGLHRLWKHFTIQISGVREGDRVLDVAGGTADLSLAFARKVGRRGQVWLTSSQPISAGVRVVSGPNIAGYPVLAPIERRAEITVFPR